MRSHRLRYPNTTGEAYQKRWPADVHMVGKDILRFHTVYWPAFLMAAELEPPKRVFAHGWWTNNGQKISKSLGNAINPLDLIRTYGLDQTRYYMLRNVAFGNDGDFSRKTMIDTINSHLANGLGNLAQRSLSMIHKNCDGKVPVSGDLTEADQTLLNKAAALPNLVRKEFDDQAFHRALDAIWEVVGAGNKYMDEQAPWSLSKSDTQRMNTVLYVLGETIRHVAVVVQPFMPDAMSNLLDQLAVPKEQRLIQNLSPEFALKSGIDLPAPTGVFPRYIEGGEGARVPQKKAGAKGKPFNLG
jgi:methionyl-tRNA synthetase